MDRSSYASRAGRIAALAVAGGIGAVVGLVVGATGRSWLAPAEGVGLASSARASGREVEATRTAEGRERGLDPVLRAPMRVEPERRAIDGRASSEIVAEGDGTARRERSSCEPSSRESG